MHTDARFQLAGDLAVQIVSDIQAKGVRVVLHVGLAEPKSHEILVTPPVARAIASALISGAAEIR